MTLVTKRGLLNLIPDARWVPHDMPNVEGSEKARHSLFARHLSGKGKSHGQTPAAGSSDEISQPQFQLGRRRKSTLSLTGSHDPALDARTKDQMQSMFFGKLPYEIRIMIYEFLAGEGETIHLTLGNKRKNYGHFICEKGYEDDEAQSRDYCGCKILVGGGRFKKLDSGFFSFLRTCRRV
jgi:hypothetical protein